MTNYEITLFMIKVLDSIIIVFVAIRTMNISGYWRTFLVEGYLNKE